MTQKKSWKTPAAIALILVAATFFQIYLISESRFTREESMFWETALHLAQGKAFPVYGPSLSGSKALHPGPLFYYIMAIPQLLGKSPYLGGMFVFFLHLIAALFVFSMVRDISGKRAAFIALIICVFAPWEQLYANKIWPSCVAPFWGTATIFAAWRWEKSPFWQAMLGFFLITGPEIHMSSVILWLPVALIVISKPEKRKTSWLWLGAGVLLAAATYLPSIINEFINDFPNLKAGLEHGEGNGRNVLYMFEALFRIPYYPFLFSSAETGYQFAQGYWGHFNEFTYYIKPSGWIAWWRLHGFVEGTGIIISIIFSLWAWIRAAGIFRKSIRKIRQEGKEVTLTRQEALISALFTGLLGAAILLVILRKPCFPHYVNMYMPLFLTPMAFLFDSFYRKASQQWRKVQITAILGVIILTMMSVTIRYYHTVDAANGLASTLECVGRLLGETRKKALVFTDNDNTAAWKRIAENYYGKPLDTVNVQQARVIYIVHDDVPLVFSSSAGRNGFYCDRVFVEIKDK